MEAGHTSYLVSLRAAPRLSRSFAAVVVAARSGIGHICRLRYRRCLGPHAGHDVRPKLSLKAKGPRTLRCVLDAMQPVSRRRASRSPRVIEAHARSLQHLFRRLQSLAAGRAARGGDGRAWGRGLMRGLLPVWRPATRYACGGGTNLASDAAFDAQRRLAERVWSAWPYSGLHRRVLLCTAVR